MGGIADYFLSFQSAIASVGEVRDREEFLMEGYGSVLHFSQSVEIH